MKLDEDRKVEWEPELWNITLQCYTGVEIPEQEYFKRVVRDGDVWVFPTPEALDIWSVGYALVSPNYEPAPLLRSIAVRPKFRMHGCGLLLLNEVAEYYKNRASRILLHCKIDNPAQKLYFDAGYRVTKRIHNYYAPEGDGLEMEKIL